MFRLLRLTLSRDGHGRGIASREYWLVGEGSSDAIADCSWSSGGETQCHDRVMGMDNGAKKRKDTTKMGKEIERP